MQIVLAVISILMIIAVFLPLVRKDFWVYKVLEYPRLQKLTIVIIVTALWSLCWPSDEPAYKIIFGGLLLSIAYLIYKIFPYTALSKKEMRRITTANPKDEIRIFSANVLQDNRKYANMLKQVRETDPDVIFMLETDTEWARAMKELENDYPYTLFGPLENTYGLLLFSRLKLTEHKIQFLVKNDIPSVTGIIELPSGEKIRFWGLHPEPPVPGENLYSTAKDKELMMVALKVRDCKDPVLVFGDLNDVAWSHTTELFRKTSKMLDPRRGRGYYNTFSAHNWFIRFPLDYIFCTKQFALVSMKRLPKNGSDHFAMITHLQLTREEHEETPEADKEELDEAKEMASQPVKE